MQLDRESKESVNKRAMAVNNAMFDYVTRLCISFKEVFYFLKTKKFLIKFFLKFLDFL